MVNGRNKGASFEREMAQDLERELSKELYLELGQRITFKRDLEQYRASDHGDLIVSDSDFPFILELKRYKDGPIGGQEAWWQQCVRAAKAAKKLPCLIYKYDRKPVRFVIEVCAAYEAGYKFKYEPPESGRLEMDLPTFCWTARELM